MPRTSVLAHAARIDPSATDHETLERLQMIDKPQVTLLLRDSDGREAVLPAALARFVLAAVDDLAAGHAVLAIPLDTTLTPAGAGELLGLSRPFVTRLLDAGEIPSSHLPDSRHRVIKLADVLAFQARRERRAEGRQRIADVIADADLPY